jgi:hypothetical protein
MPNMLCSSIAPLQELRAITPAAAKVGKLPLPEVKRMKNLPVIPVLWTPVHDPNPVGYGIYIALQRHRPLRLQS